MKLPRRTRLSLRVQRGVSYLCFALFGPILTAIYRFRFRFSAHQVDAIRAQYRALREQHPGPLLICSNHLTLVDSIIQTIVLGSLWDYLPHPASLPWHLPQSQNFYPRLSLRLVWSLDRCIPVARAASAVKVRG